jgi:hypothetical protein
MSAKRHEVHTGANNVHRLFFLLSRQEVLSRAIDTIFWFNDFVKQSGPPLKLVKNLPHNCDLSSVFIRGNRLICVFNEFCTQKRQSRGPCHII